MGYLIDIGVGACSSFLAAEIWSHADPLARLLIRRAVSRLPEPERDRRQEEWLAHLDETPGAIRKLLHGIGCWLGAPAVGRVHAHGARQQVGTPRRRSLQGRFDERWAERLSRSAHLAPTLVVGLAFFYTLFWHADALLRAAAATGKAGSVIAKALTGLF